MSVNNFLESLDVPIEQLIVDQDLARELQCGICLHLLREPRQCRVLKFNHFLFLFYFLLKKIFF
jgi:hypothetical protein